MISEFDIALICRIRNGVNFEQNLIISVIELTSRDEG